MKLVKKVILPLMLVAVLCLNSVTALAATSSKGGTWRITNIVTSDSIANSDLPIKVTYLPSAQVKAFYNSSIQTNAFKDYLSEYGALTITTKVAQTILSKYGVTLVPLVGLAFTLGDLLAAIEQDTFNSGIQTAYNSSTGMNFTVYEVNGGDKFARCANWTGSSMPENIYFTDISGYVTGTVTIGEYNFDIGF